MKVIGTVLWILGIKNILEAMLGLSWMHVNVLTIAILGKMRIKNKFLMHG